MNIKDGLDLPGRIVEIPDTGRDEFAKYLFENGYIKGVEVGVDKGDYGRVLAEAGLKVTGVDCWENYSGYKRLGAYKSNMEMAIDNLKGLNYKIIRKYSMDALDDFEDESLDFVYIDANHTLPYVCLDIFGWERKVRKGGIISGHDYANIKGFGERSIPRIYDGCHVKSAVHACIDVMKVQKLYILGERNSESRDKWRSFFWIK